MAVEQRDVGGPVRRLPIIRDGHVLAADDPAQRGDEHMRGRELGFGGRRDDIKAGVEEDDALAFDELSREKVCFLAQSLLVVDSVGVLEHELQLRAFLFDGARNKAGDAPSEEHLLFHGVVDDVPKRVDLEDDRCGDGEDRCHDKIDKEPAAGHFGISGLGGHDRGHRRGCVPRSNAGTRGGSRRAISSAGTRGGPQRAGCWEASEIRSSTCSPECIPSRLPHGKRRCMFRRSQSWCRRRVRRPLRSGRVYAA